MASIADRKNKSGSPVDMSALGGSLGNIFGGKKVGVMDKGYFSAKNKVKWIYQFDQGKGLNFLCLQAIQCFDKS